MGGNLGVKGFKAQKIPVKELGLKKFQRDFKKLFYKLDELFFKQNGEYIWKTKRIIDDGYVFDGSASLLMKNDVSSNILELKPFIGDIDIMVPKNLKEKLWEFLENIENKQIENFTYIGNNKPSISSIGEQINALFEYYYKKDKCIYVQVDFRFVEFEEKNIINKKEYIPTMWSKFSHCASIEDLKIGVKAVFHKILLRSLAYASSYTDNAIFVTPSANCENWEKKISKSKKRDNHLLKFSVSRGIRIAYEPLICDGKHVQKDGKFVYRKLKTDESIYYTDIDKIFEMIFGIKPNDEDINNFWSFMGLIKLMKKYFDEEKNKLAFYRFLELLWDNDEKNIAQELERDNPELDYQIKINSVNYLLKEFSFLKNEYEKWLSKIDSYYKKYGLRKTNKMFK